MDHRSVVRQTTVFDPAGYVRLAYWYLLYPVHHRVFSRMLRGVQRAMRPEGTATPTRQTMPEPGHGLCRQVPH
jgi:hypothetical protein